MLPSTFKHAMGRKRETSSSLSGFSAMSDMYTIPKDVGVVPDVKHLHMIVYIVMAQHAILLDTMHGIPTVPVTNPCDHSCNMSDNSYQDGGPVVMLCVCGFGRDIRL